jgi:hypothetical protein
MEQFTMRNDSLTHTSIVSRGLPSADSIAKCGGSNQDKSALILQCLRRTAQKNRRKKSRPFYSIRAVASHFAVPPTTVSRIFTRLRDEGILTTVWGSRTFVQPFHLDKQLRIRGVVALPALLSTFCILPETRMFFANARNALWKLGFATRLLFYQGDEGETPAFAEKLLSYKPDAVIWLLPNSRNRKVAARVLDRGVRLITIGDFLARSGEHPYYVDRKQAIIQGLRSWKADGINFVTIVEQHSADSAGTLSTIEASLRELAIPYSVEDGALRLRRECVAAMKPQGNYGFILASSELAMRLSLAGPAMFPRIFEGRVMLINGSIDVPGATSLCENVDSIAMDWHLAAKRIARDLINPAPTNDEMKAVIFEAKWVPKQTRIPS